MIDKSLVHKIFNACQTNNLEYLKARDVQDLSRARDESGAGCVHYCVRADTGVESLAYIVQQCGLSVNQTSSVGSLPIHDACVKGEICLHLLNNGVKQLTHQYFK